jgi:hypothetical protein
VLLSGYMFVNSIAAYAAPALGVLEMPSARLKVVRMPRATPWGSAVQYRVGLKLKSPSKCRPCDEPGCRRKDPFSKVVGLA